MTTRCKVHHQFVAHITYRNGAALVEIYRRNFDGSPNVRLQRFETLGKGATKVAMREMRHLTPGVPREAANQ